MSKLLAFVFIVLFTGGCCGNALAQAKTDSLKIIRNIKAEGSCAVVGMTAEQCQLLALQRARAAAIEQAAGVSVTSSTLVTNSALAVDFIKTYARGFVVKEAVEWLPLAQYQKDRSTPPIPEYRVRLLADVYAPERNRTSIGLKARLNAPIFRAGEKAVITVETRRKAKIAVFNITADDRVAMVFPNVHDRHNMVSGGEPFLYPAQQSLAELVMHTLKGHKTDAEAFFVVAVDAESQVDFMDLFSPSRATNFVSFFKVFSEIARYCDDTILAYEVISAGDR